MVKKKPTKSDLVFIGAFVPKSVKAALEEYATKEARTVSSTVRVIIENAPGIKATLRDKRVA